MSSSSDIVILCIADSAARLTYISRTVKKLGYGIYIAHSNDHAVAVVAASTNSIGAIVMDEDLLLNGFSVSESLKMVSAVPILLVCNKGAEGKPKPAGIDLVTDNGSREGIGTGLKKLLAKSMGAVQS